MIFKIVFCYNVLDLKFLRMIAAGGYIMAKKRMFSLEVEDHARCQMPEG